MSLMQDTPRVRDDIHLNRPSGRFVYLRQAKSGAARLAVAWVARCRGLARPESCEEKTCLISV